MIFYEHALDKRIWFAYDDLIRKLDLTIGEAVQLFIKEKLYTSPPNKYHYHYPTKFATDGDMFNPPFVIQALARDGSHVFRWNLPRVRMQIFHETMPDIANCSNLPDLRDW